MINLGSILPVGTIIHSMLTTTQFAAEYGDNWVIMDGRSVAGTKYAAVTGNSTIPDARGTFLRAKGATYNPDGDLAVGTYTADRLVAHVHNITAHTGNNPGQPYIQASGDGVTPVSIPTASTGSSETSPRSTTVNVFIRIN